MKFCAHKTFKNKRPVQELFLGFRSDPLPFLLESSRNVMGMGRYSFFGSEPFLTLKVRRGLCVIEQGGNLRTVCGSALSVLRDLLETYALKGAGGLSSPLLCGAVGFFSYDFGFSLEKIRRNNLPDPLVPEAMFGFYDCVTCVDHLKNEMTVFSCGFPERGRFRRLRADARLKAILKKWKTDVRETHGNKDTKMFSDNRRLVSNFSKSRYLAAVRRAKDYIARGDIYQVNLSQMFRACTTSDDWALYRRLTENFPVSFSAFFDARDFSIISASPERFLNFDGRFVSTRPMKGTRPRAPGRKEDQRLRKELAQSKKEKAELLMIVDLERNDLGRVCDYGSVKVESLRRIETYANVFQATAEIKGRLHKDRDRLDLIRACFPGGSVTGCPKIRAMEVIEELEPVARSIYTGALGYFSFHNTLEFNILIRSFLKKKDEIFFHVGGGIVTDSGPADEYDETLVKGKALMEALRHADHGIV